MSGVPAQIARWHRLRDHLVYRRHLWRKERSLEAATAKMSPVNKMPRMSPASRGARLRMGDDQLVQMKKLDLGDFIEQCTATHVFSVARFERLSK